MPIFLVRRLRHRMVYDDVHWRAIADRLRANPMDPDALFACAAYLASEHRMKEAVEFLNDLAKVVPQYPGLWRFKARLYQEMGKTNLASLCRERGYASP